VAWKPGPAALECFVTCHEAAEDGGNLTYQVGPEHDPGGKRRRRPCLTYAQQLIRSHTPLVRRYILRHRLRLVR
jgi:hypothetical protein